MKPEIAELLATTLESDRFKQGSGNLCSITPSGLLCYCCLGVLCELAIEAGVPLRKTVYSMNVAYEDACGISSAKHLPPEVIRWAGMRKDNIMETDPIRI